MVWQIPVFTFFRYSEQQDSHALTKNRTSAFYDIGGNRSLVYHCNTSTVGLQAVSCLFSPGKRYFASAQQQASHALHIRSGRFQTFCAF